MIHIGIVFLILLVDGSCKKYIEKNVKKGEERLVCKEKIILTKSHNKGAAFRILEEHPVFLKFISGGVLVGLSVSLLQLMREKKKKELKLALSFILGGGLGNYVDRLTRGYVVDYFTFAGKDKKVGKKIIFNLADFCIFFGSMLVALFQGKKLRK